MDIEHIFEAIKELKFERSDIIAIASLFIAGMTFLYTFISRYFDKRARRLEFLESKLADLCEIYQRLQLDLIVIEEKFALSHLKELGMHEYLKSVRKDISGNALNSAINLQNLVTKNRKKIKLKRIEELIIQVEDMRQKSCGYSENIRARMDNAYDRYDKILSTKPFETK
ncbi:hypothetical protein PAHA111176_20755 [Parendozoicomonas haliclonae]|uniref:Uncharacterized protein n=2 Tax=Parendozoicomonas haliclonae TaxID=1960125 RepID=A0A1X7ARM3_9GAMM|nr:hypothetical protein EHSB41UT_04792 [Parendozoicomonas haliclonae]